MNVITLDTTGNYPAKLVFRTSDNFFNLETAHTTAGTMPMTK